MANRRIKNEDGSESELETNDIDLSNEKELDNSNNKEIKIESSESSDIKKELEKVNSEKRQMEETLKKMQEQIENMKKQTSTNVTIQQVSNPNSTRSVKVTNMLPYGMVLSVTNSRTVFSKFGESIPIKFGYMNEIVTKYLSYIDDGRIVFEKQEDYEDLNVGYAYNSAMKLEYIEDLILFKRQDSIKTILGLDKNIQERIIPLIADAWVDGRIGDYTPIKQLEDKGLDIDAIIKIKKSNKEISE